MADPLEISMQGTPNPNAAKFTLNRMVAAQGKTYRDPAADGPEWAKRILGVEGVTQVFAINNFISVSKTTESNWDVIGSLIEGILREAFA